MNKCMRTYFNRFRKFTIGIFIAAFLCAGLWFGGLYWLSLEIKNKQPEIQEYLQQKIGIPLQYDGVETRTHLNGVSFVLKNIVVKNLSVQTLEVYPDLLGSLLQQKLIFKDIVVQGFKTQYHWKSSNNKQDNTKEDENKEQGAKENNKHEEKLDELKKLLAKFGQKQRITLKEAEIVWTGEFGQIIQRVEGQLDWVAKASFPLQFRGSQALKFNEGDFFDEASFDFNFDPDTERGYLKAGLDNAELECHVDKENGLNCVIKADQVNFSNVHRNLVLKEIKHGWIPWLIQALSSGYAEGQAKIHGQPGNLDWQGEFRFHKVNMKYGKDWPGIKKAKGTVKIEKGSVWVHAHSGNILETSIHSAKVTIAPIASGKPVFVTVESELSGRLEQGLEFLRQSPLQKVYHRVLSISPQGPMKLSLNLKIPANKAAMAEASTEVLGNLKVKQARLWVSEINAPIDELRGMFEFTEKGLMTKTPAEGEFLKRPITIAAKKSEGITAKTFLTTEFLQQKFSNPTLKNLQGGAEVELHIPNENDYWTLTSNLKGVAIDLPKPLGKAKEEIRPVTVGLKKLKNEYMYTLDTELLNTQLSYDSREPNTWYLKGPMFSGNVILPSNKNNVLRINLEQLHITGNEGGDYKKQMTDKFLSGNSRMPVIFACKNLSLSGKNFGQVNFTLEPIPGGYNIRSLTANAKIFQLEGGGEWYFKGEGGKAGTAIRGQLSSHNLGNAFANLGLTSAFRSGSGKIKFDLYWGNHPLDFSLAHIQGNAVIVMNSGRILGVDPGLGRVIGLLNVESIHRRLQLDFKDVYKKGFAFDSLEGSLLFKNGMATTERFMVVGPAAKISLTGSANLETKALNVRMYVTPKLMSSSLPIAAGLATGNPAVGLGVWMFDKITNSSLSNITQFQYQVGGTWETPSIVETGAGAFQRNKN